MISPKQLNTIAARLNRLAEKAEELQDEANALHEDLHDAALKLGVQADEARADELKHPERYE